MNSDEQTLKTTGAHAWFTLVGSAFVVFQIIFVTLFSNEFWFALNLRWLGPVAVLIAIPIAHLLLSLQETPRAIDLLSFIWKEKPPIIYRSWLTLNDPLFGSGIRFGNRNIAWNVIDSVELSFLGNLVLRSRTVSGAAPKTDSKFDAKLTAPEVVLKFPFGVGSYDDQKKLIELIQQARPDVVLNDRLKKKLDTPELKAAAKIPQLGAIFLTLVLFDVGYSLFSYLECMKCFYLAQRDAIAGNNTSAAAQYAEAVDIKNHPLPISWVTYKVMKEKPVGPGVNLAQADALWLMGKHNEAIECAEKALELSPKNFRTNLQLARMFAAEGKISDAEHQLELAKENHKDSFLPQLYMVALKQKSPTHLDEPARAAYSKYREELDGDLFADEPHWPPSGDRFLHDVWYRKDVDFVWNKLIYGKPKP